MKYHDPGVDDVKIVTARREFLQNLPLLHAEAMRLGLFVTGRAIHNAVKASGWEVAGDTTKAAKYAPDLDGI
jgi:hypothetical protein